MTKEQYIKHIEDTEHIKFPKLGENPSDWKKAQEKHMAQNCPACLKRIKTRRAENKRKAKNEAMESLGLVKVKGNLGGTYWE